MNMKQLLVAAVLSISTSNLFAANIVDTGPGGAVGPQWTLRGDQWLAGEFSIGTAAVVTDVQGWMASTVGGTATAAIYTDGGDIPGSQLFFAPFSASVNPAGDWFGATGQTWLLPAGTYWAAFEVRPGQTFDGGMPSPAPSPLGAYSFTFGGVYQTSIDLDFGVRILGTQVAAIPEPSTYALMLAGLGFVGFVANRRRKAQTVEA
jgi:hypothetical protein